MTKNHGMKRSLFLSVLSMLLCVSMLVGTTFAWFTDSVTSGTNRIVAGNLDIELEYADSIDSSGTTKWTQVKEDTALLDYDFWEPGYTKVVYLKIVNKGSLALKYRLDILPADPKAGDTSEAKLEDVIDVYVIDQDGTAAGLKDRAEALKGTSLGTLSKVMDGMVVTNGSLTTETGKTEHYIALVFHMQESAGNEYQGLSVGDGFGIALSATQYTYEKDSFDEKYDEDAELKVPTASFSKAVADAIKESTSGTTGTPEPVEIDLSGDLDVSDSADGIPVNGNVDITINGGEDPEHPTTVTVDHTLLNHRNELNNEGVLEGKLTFKNIVFESTADMTGFATVLGFGSNTEVVFENCTFKGLYAAVYCNAGQNGSSITFKNCKFEGTKYGVGIYDSTDCTVTFENCTGDAALVGDNEFPEQGTIVGHIESTLEKTIEEALKDAEGENVEVTLDGDVGFGSNPNGVQIEDDTNLTVDGNGNTILIDHSAFNNNDGLEGIGKGTLTFKDVVFEADGDDPNGKFAAVLGFDSDVTITFENCTFKGLYSAVCANPSASGHQSTITFTNCTFENTNYGVSIDPHTEDGTYTVTFNNCTYGEGFAERESFD